MRLLSNGEPLLIDTSLASATRHSVGHCGVARGPLNLEVALLTGGIDPPYVFGLTMALLAKGVRLEVIGSDKLDRPEMHGTNGLTFLNLQNTLEGEKSVVRRAWGLLVFYVRFLRYISAAKPKIFHILLEQ